MTEKRELTDQIQEAAAQAFDLPPSDLTGPSRAAVPLQARQLAIYLCREMTDLSLPQIGRQFGGRDHATILNAVRRIEKKEREGDPETRRRLEQLRGEIHRLRSQAA